MLIDTMRSLGQILAAGNLKLILLYGDCQEPWKKVSREWIS